MKTIQDLMLEYYKEFVGYPGHRPIVRSNQENDALELVVLKILYGKELPEFIKSNVSEFAKYIIAPPDNGIDIFMQYEDGDDSSFDVIQVKASKLDEASLRNAFLGMQRTIDDFCKNPLSVKSENCREILSNSNLCKTNKNRCTYYVVHLGEVDDFSGSNDNERVITKNLLEVLYNNLSENVDKDVLTTQSRMNYGDLVDSNGAIVCSLNGYDLAELSNKYYYTEVGRNLLFGSNLRESLITRKSKAYMSMRETILNCPENFWYYNNGITIIAKEINIDPNNPTKVHLSNFSVVNGAQTTSSLGLFLKEARINQRPDEIELLKKVYVLTRILKVSEDTMRENIAIYNNSQTPITTRDMVANRPEQKYLNKWMMDDYPQIYVEIRRGASTPGELSKKFTHRKTTNEGLAQLAYAYFLQRPFTAKDKKSALFNKDYNQKDEYVINKIYDEVFLLDEENPGNKGIIFTKSKQEIDEALFVQQLYKETRKFMKKTLTERNLAEQSRLENETNITRKKNIEKRIETNSLYLDTIGICMFYFIALYAEFKDSFDEAENTTRFDYEKYYFDKDYKQRLIEKASNLFLMLTVKILTKTAEEANKKANVNNWVRSQICETKFFEALREEIASDLELEEKYRDFVEEFKI